MLLLCASRGAASVWRRRPGGEGPGEGLSPRRLQRPLHFRDPLLVAFVERPLLDALAADESCAGQHLEMLAGGRGADAELFGDAGAADAVFGQVAVDLGREVRDGVLEPGKD